MKRSRQIVRALIFFFTAVICAHADVDYGELRLRVTDPSGAALKTKVELTSAANGYDRVFSTTSSGTLHIPHLPFGVYRVEIKQQGFAPFSAETVVHSAVPVEQSFHLELAPVVTQVEVTPDDNVVDLGAVSSSTHIGSQEIENRPSFLPGRSVQDLIVSQPGWAYEGNAVLHPRGSEYQTQFVIDGIPLTDNRSPSFGPEIEADDLESMSISTAGYSAEYGRKMGGVVELNTHRPDDPGVHGHFVLDGGSYDTVSGFGDLEAVVGRNAYGGSASGSLTDHYLNPVVPENYTNHGSTSDYSGRFARDFSSADRLNLSIRRESARFLVPNEFIQQQAGQQQNRDNFETVGTASYQHILSPESLVTLSGMARDNSNDLSSNASSTPVLAFLNDGFREGYLKVNYTLHHGRHEFKAGAESDNSSLCENFRYTVSDPDFFDDDTPQSFNFNSHRPDLEQGAWVEDTVRLGNWTARAGLRWDHYQLLANEHALSPRISLARAFPRTGSVLHASFDRIFQTPSFENILLSSSAEVQALSDDFLRLPVKPSRGNYYEGGLAQALSTRARLDANVYRRDVNNLADDDQLLNTGVSYPIAFNKAVIYGAEAKLSLIRLNHFSGFASYSYMVGAVWFPVTGGLFLGDDVDEAANQTQGHFPNTQDQRNAFDGRLQYTVSPRLWLAAGIAYDSGLPFEFGGDQATALAQYGPVVLSRINFDRGRIRPQTLVDASAGVTLRNGKEHNLVLQITGENLTNQLNVIDFGGLFSGNAIGPGRSVYARLRASF